MRDFEEFLAFCHANKNRYEYLAFKGAFGTTQLFEQVGKQLTNSKN